MSSTFLFPGFLPRGQRHASLFRRVPCMLLLAIAIPAGAVADATIRIEGTTVSLKMPDGFETSSDFSGIISPESSASIHVVEMPAPVDELKQQLTADNLATQGMQLLESESVDAGLGAATLLSLSQASQGMSFRKWMLVGGDDDQLVLLTATVPEVLAAELGDTLQATLTSATWEPDREIDPLEGLGFSVVESGGLEIAGSMMGSTLALTEGGVLATKAPGDPLLVIARSPADTDRGDLDAFARARLEEMVGLADIAVESSAVAEVAGMTAVEMVATAEAEGNTAVVVYQLMAYDGEHFFLAQGRTGAAQRDPWLEHLREVAMSLSVDP